MARLDLGQPQAGGRGALCLEELRRSPGLLRVCERQKGEVNMLKSDDIGFYRSSLDSVSNQGRVRSQDMILL